MFGLPDCVPASQRLSRQTSCVPSQFVSPAWCRIRTFETRKKNIFGENLLLFFFARNSASWPSLQKLCFVFLTKQSSLRLFGCRLQTDKLTRLLSREIYWAFILVITRARLRHWSPEGKVKLRNRTQTQ